VGQQRRLICQLAQLCKKAVVETHETTNDEVDDELVFGSFDFLYHGYHEGFPQQKHQILT
tara:strand:+ start:316 stop:495 length:180 start_codon:yes stop_codon:yes gene_type:complete